MADLFNFDSEKPQVDNPVDLNPLVGHLLNPQGPVRKPSAGGVLGVLGDLIGGIGGIGDIIKKRKIESVMGGWHDNPEGTIEEVMKLDPKFGTSLLNVYSDNKRADSSQDVNTAYKEAQIAARDQAVGFKNRGIATAHINSIMNNKGMKPEEKAAAYAAILPQLRGLPANAFFDPAKDLPDSYDEGYLTNYANSGMSVKEQDAQSLGERRQDHKESYDTSRLGQYDRGLDQTDRRLGQGDRSLDIREEGVGIQRDRADAYIRNANKSGAHGKIAMRYPGDDGYYHVQYEDGTDVASNYKVRPTGKPSILQQLQGGKGGGSAPPPPRKPGDRIRGPGGVILTSKDGKTWSK